MEQWAFCAGVLIGQSLTLGDRPRRLQVRTLKYSRTDAQITCSQAINDLGVSGKSNEVSVIRCEHSPRAACRAVLLWIPCPHDTMLLSHARRILSTSANWVRWLAQPPQLRVCSAHPSNATIAVGYTQGDINVYCNVLNKVRAAHCGCAQQRRFDSRCHVPCHGGATNAAGTEVAWHTLCAQHAPGGRARHFVALQLRPDRSARVACGLRPERMAAQRLGVRCCAS